MMEVVWTNAARADLQRLLSYVSEQSPQGAATIVSRVMETELGIATFPRAARCDRIAGFYERVVRGLPLLMIYEIVSNVGVPSRVEIIAVFHTAQNPSSKPHSGTL